MRIRPIRANADESATRLSEALGRPPASADEGRRTLDGYARSLLTLLTSEVPLALDRAAMGSPALASTLLESGRHRVGPLATAYLRSLHECGVSPHADADRAFSFLYGLVVQDTQIRVLLGEVPPSPDEVATRASWAVEVFLSADPV